jgi:hypothetical protein
MWRGRSKIKTKVNETKEMIGKGKGNLRKREGRKETRQAERKK